MGRITGSINRRRQKDKLIKAVEENDHRTLDYLVLQFIEKNQAEKILTKKGYQGNLLEAVRRLPHKGN